MNRTDRIPLSPRRPSLSGRFLCPHAAIFGFHSHACSPCVELIGPASRPGTSFLEERWQMRSIPDLSPSTPQGESIHATLPTKSGELWETKLRFSPKSPLLFLKIPRFPKESCGFFDLGRLQNAESRTKKIYFGLATCEKLLTFVVR